MIASETGGTFGLCLETEKATNGDPMPPGSMLMMGRNNVRVYTPDSKSTIYFFALTMWILLVGEDAKKYAKDTRLPDFVRKTIAQATK